MKTNQVMKRWMGRFKVEQRTKDGMFNATNLLRQWNRLPGTPKRDLSRFWTLETINEFINTVIREEMLDTPSEVYVKSRASRGKNAGTWMHPILFIKYAMWINPEFEYFVIKFVSDQLIRFRYDAGDLYRIIGLAASRFQDTDYAKIANALNYYDDLLEEMRRMYCLKCHYCFTGKNKWHN